MTLSGYVPEPLLETTANNLSAEGRRRVRFERREVLWRASSLQRIRHCGRVAVDSDRGVTFRCGEALAGFAGLQHCGSVWSCSVCAGRILVHRALEIGSVLGQAIDQGYGLAFITLTMQHSRNQVLQLLWGAGQKGWQRSISGRGWVQVEHLVNGWVRVWEVTYGSNGWHVHVHCVVILTPGSGDAELDQVAGGMFERWSRGLVAAGLSAPRRIGQDWHLVEGATAADQVGEYLAKMADGDTRPDPSAGLGLELTHTMPGRSARGLSTRPTWGLLDDLVMTGEASALHLWHEWESVSKGKRQVGWSKGLRERFAPDVDELTDDEIVDREIGSAEQDIAHWNVQQWRSFVATPGRQLRLIEVGERGGAAAALALLDHWEVPYGVVSKGSTDGNVEAEAGPGSGTAEVPGIGEAGRGDQAHGASVGST